MSEANWIGRQAHDQPAGWVERSRNPSPGVGDAGMLAWSREDVAGIAAFIIGLTDGQTHWIKSPFDRVAYDGFREELNPSCGLI